MQLRTGVDLVEISRIEKAVERHGERFLQRIYTPQEIIDCKGRPNSLAARFAAKEAVSKAFGTGIGPMDFTDIEVQRTEHGAPRLILHGNAQKMADQQNLNIWSLSLSHTETHAIAFVVALSSTN